MTKPTCGTKVITRNGFHKRIPVRSYLVALTEIGGSRVKAVRLRKIIRDGDLRESSRSWTEISVMRKYPYKGSHE